MTEEEKLQLKKKLVIESINSQIQNGKELVEKGEITKEGYPLYLALAFQKELEILLDVKFDTAIPN